MLIIAAMMPAAADAARHYLQHTAYALLRQDAVTRNIAEEAAASCRRRRAPPPAALMPQHAARCYELVYAYLRAAC